MMNLYEFADIIDKNIVITRYANQDSRFSAQFEHCDTKRGGCLCGEYGDGKTPQEAVDNYKNKIIGKTIVFNAMSDTYRREYVVPQLYSI